MNISNSIGYIGEYIGSGVMIGYIGRGVKILYNRCKLVDNIFFGGNDVQKKIPNSSRFPVSVLAGHCIETWAWEIKHLLSIH